MSEKIMFQFNNNLDYQIKAVNSVIELFRGLEKKTTGIYENLNTKKKRLYNDPIQNPDIIDEDKLLSNLNKIQLNNSLFADNDIKNNNFTIEMETGTGKTYVYLRTILELYKEYDLKKFIIVVPSIPIRKGIEKSIEMLSEHFKTLYNVDISKHSFVYSSSTPEKISADFIEKNDLSICILNIQSFNKKNTNVIRSEDLYGRILWEEIKFIKPVIIIDEPQKIEGTKKKSKSLEAIEEISPLFVLRYSATHRNLYNQVYKLDSYEAYKRRLVKSIEVKTVNSAVPKDFPYIRYIEFTEDLYAKIEIFSQKQGKRIKFENFKVRGNDSLYNLSGGLEQYKNIRIIENPHKLKPLKIHYQNYNTFELEQGKSTYTISENQSIRMQIQIAIETHFKKQQKIFKSERKIKALTLFFTDSVNKVRDNTQKDGRGEYLKIFDEEYTSFVKSKTFYNMFKDYEKYYNSILFSADNNEEFKVREGYFAVDKKKNVVDIKDWNSSLSDDEIKICAKSQEDIARGIELILDKKDELISFNEPLCFIFSHSALREGWDNPNIFTICTLKQSSNDIAKKQEIGRGLRLPVDSYGLRCIDENINELTVIVNDNYEHFANMLQKDFNESSSFNKDEVTTDIIIDTFNKAGIPENKINFELVDKFRNELFSYGIIDKNNILLTKAKDIIEDISFIDKTLDEHCEFIIKIFKENMIEKGSKKISVKNGDNEPLENEINPFYNKDIYLNAKDILKIRTMYKVNIDSDKFINNCCYEINKFLAYKKSEKDSYYIESGLGEYKKTGKFELLKSKTKKLEAELKNKTEIKSDFEIANYIMYNTNLPRLTIFKILSQIENKNLLSKQDILDDSVSKINHILKNTKADFITNYEIIEKYEFDEKDIFELDNINEEILNENKKVYISDAANKKALNKYYIMDSKGEYTFAENLDDDDNVVFFTKLKKGGFFIDTPYGHYTPDWFIAYKKNDKILYLIAETKCGKSKEDLSNVEQQKIKFAKLHFNAVSKSCNIKAKCDWVSDYENFKEKFELY